jgi:hypothetical protein
MKRLKLDFLVATDRGGIVATIEQAWKRILLFKQFAVLLFNKSSQRKMLCVWRRLLSFLASTLILRFVFTRRTSAGSSGASRTSTGSSSITFRKFSERLKGKMGQCREWFNRSRFHGGVKTFPAELYEGNVRNLT